MLELWPARSAYASERMMGLKKQNSKRKLLHWFSCFDGVFYGVKTENRGIKPYRFRITLKVIRVIHVICEICGLKIIILFFPD